MWPRRGAVTPPGAVAQEVLAPMQRSAYAPDDYGRQAEQQIIAQVLRSGDGTRWTHDQLQDRLTAVEPKAICEALARLMGRGVLNVDGDAIEARDSASQRDTLDQLSAVVVHVLVTAYPKTLTLAEVAEQCERDLDKPDERHEVELALLWIEGDGLACAGDGGWIATRPAVRAAELSF